MFFARVDHPVARFACLTAILVISSGPSTAQPRAASLASDRRESEARGSDPCEIFQQSLSRAAWDGVTPVEQHLPTRRGGGAARGGGIQAFIDGSRVLHVVGTTLDDSVALRLKASDPTTLQVNEPADQTPVQTFEFALADFDSIAIQLDLGTDLLVFDDVNGDVAPLKPYAVDAGDGDDTIVARTGTLTLAQVLSIVATLDTARNLAQQADAIVQLAGATTSLGSGNDVISNSIALLQDAHDDFIIPASDYIADINDQLIRPASDTAVDARDVLIAAAMNLTDTAYNTLVLPAEQMRDDAQQDLVNVALGLVADAQNDLLTQANQVLACADQGLATTDANAFIATVQNLSNQIVQLAESCPPEPNEPPEGADPCPLVQELIDCLELEIDRFVELADICEESGDALADAGDAFAYDAENDLEAEGDQFEIDAENFELVADNFVLQGDALIATGDAFEQQVTAALEGAGDALLNRADAEFVQVASAYDANADAQVRALADQIAADADQLIADAEQIIAAGTYLLDQATRGSAPDCASIQTNNTISGGPGPNILLGSGQNDAITGGGGADLIIGGAGDDKLYGDDGTDLIFGGSGTNEIHGGDGLDILIGGNDKDCIFGDDGLDVVLGRDGADEIEGGAYIDVLLGGDAADNASGGDGIDVILGQAGNDGLKGDACIDVILGGTEDDTIEGGDGQTVSIGQSFSVELGNVLFGGDGDDVMHGQDPNDTGAGIDVMFGGAGDDDMNGANGGDLTIGNFTLKLGNVMFGGTGDDTVASKEGIDVLFGGDGNDQMSSQTGDVLSLSNGDFTLPLGDLIFGGNQNDTIDSDEGSNDPNDPNSPLNDIDVVFGGDGDDTINAYSGGDMVISSFTLKLGNVLFGGADNDTISAEDGIDLVFAADGNDVVQVGNGADISFDNGDFLIEFGDLVFGGGGGDTIHADVPQDPNSGTDDGMDLIFGGDGADKIYAGTGGEIVIAGESFLFGNLLFGGSGDDEITADYQQGDPNNPEEGIDLIFGGPDDDTIKAGPGADVTIGQIPNVFYVNFGNIVFGAEGNDNIDSGDGFDLLFGGPENDTITSHDGIDLVFGGRGDDTIDAADGGIVVIPISGVPTPIPLGNILFGNDDEDDITSAGDVTQIDLLFGNPCDDVIHAGDGLLDLVFGNKGNDHLYTEAGVDLVFGGRGDDLLDCGGGLLDLAFGGRGADEMHGGADIDVLFGNRDGDDIYGDSGTIDLIFGNRENDRVHGGPDIDVVFGGDGGDELFGDDALDLIFGGKKPDILHGGLGIDILFGNTGRDLVYGDDDLDVIFGNKEDDEIYGGGSTDVLFGNTGGDRIFGDAQVDVIFGNDDNDKIFGGSETGIVFGGAGDDLLVGESALDLLFGGQSADRVYGGGGTDLIFGNDDPDTLLGETGVDLVFGNRGNDLIDGGDNADFVFGNSDGDQLLSSGGGDVLFGNNDGDTVNSGGDGSTKDWLFGCRGDDTLNGCNNSDFLWGGRGSDTKHKNDCSGFSFGDPSCSEIRGTVFVDRDFDSIADAPLPGVTVYLDNNNNGALDTGEPSTLSQSDNPDTYPNETGAYAIGGLAAGTYRVRQDLPTGLTQLSPSGAHVVGLGIAQRSEPWDFLDRDNCPPDPNGLSCGKCECPPGYIAQPTSVLNTLECDNTGAPCVTDDDCDCGGTCATHYEVLDCDCVPVVPECRLAGDQDDFAATGDPEDVIVMRPELAAWLARPGGNNSAGHGGQPLPFDVVAQALRWDFGYTFMNLPPVASATLTIHLRASDNAPQNDTLQLQFLAPGPPPNFVASYLLAALDGDGTWVAGDEVTAVLDVTALITSDYLDVFVGDDTGVDYIELCYVPVMNAPGADDPHARPLPADADDADVDGGALPPGAGGLAILPWLGGLEPALSRDRIPPAAPGAAPAPHDIPKNRYISFTPNNGRRKVAFEIIVPPCRRGWVGEPTFVGAGTPDAAWVSFVVNQPVYRVWREEVVHVRGCVIVPEQQYELRAFNVAGLASNPLILNTVTPWGDIVGPFTGQWSPPDGVVDFNDEMAIQQKMAGDPAAPHMTRVDLAPQFVDYLADDQDLLAFYSAQGGQPYPPDFFGITSLEGCTLDDGQPACPQPCGDLDGDGDVDQADAAILLGAMGQHAGEPGFVACADYDGDGAITLADYQLWIECYNGAGGLPLPGQ
ncbi:MAG: hypothetical protein HRF50_16490 [Phycisphaerae bacterium]|jgi:Ca2+-binding RTX toxin-like protein